MADKRIIKTEIEDILKSNGITIELLEECWKITKEEYPAAADSFMETYFGDDNTENWENPGAIDVLDFSDLKAEILERYKVNFQTLLLNPTNKMSPEDKIIYAFLWKNAGMDLKKIPAIISGLLQEKREDESEIRDCYGYTNFYKDITDGTDNTVFYQYGLYLKSKKDGNVNFTEVEPIIDQHTLRAWYYLNKEDESINCDNKKEPIQNRTNIAEYKKFYQTVVQTASEGDVKKSKKAFYLLNAIMFVVGKGLKKGH